MEETIKDIHLHDELLTAAKLIRLGFGEFQNLNLANDFYYLPFQLLSSGFERLMKCYICLGHHEQKGIYPNNQDLKQCAGVGGHDLLELKRTILKSYFSDGGIPALKEDFDLLNDDQDLESLIYLLSEFGKYARYHNFDIVTSATKQSINVRGTWEKYEINLIKSIPGMLEKLKSHETAEEALNYSKRIIIVKLEKFARAICRQFTMGGLGNKARQFSPVLHEFILLKDESLGIRNYRLETTRYQEGERKVHHRTLIDEVQRAHNPQYRHAVIRKAEFNGDWPFYSDEVIIECREKNWCVVTIGNRDYALNGAAAGRYKLEHVHDAGMAVLGKSIGPFIQMALKLGEGI